jgi:hypothetical protein
MTRDIQLVSNHAVLYARSDYEVWSEPERQRQLLRLGLSLVKSLKQVFRRAARAGLERSPASRQTGAGFHHPTP